MAVIELDVDQLFFINDSFDTVAKYLNVDQLWTINQNSKSQYNFQNLNQTYNLGQIIDVRFSIRNLTINQDLFLDDQGYKTLTLQIVNNTYHPYQVILITPDGIIDQNYNINQVISIDNTKGVIHTLTISQNIILNFYKTLTVTQTLNLNNVILLNQVNGCCGSLINIVLGGPNSDGGDVF